MTARTYGDALASITEVMLYVHEQTCPIEAPHRWERCTATPTVYAVADGLDVCVGSATAPVVSGAMHDRECEVAMCRELGQREKHAKSWDEQAGALMAWAAMRAADPLPPVASIRGDLTVVCECGCVRRNHSVDGTRCYRHGLCRFTPRSQ